MFRYNRACTARWSVLPHARGDVPFLGGFEMLLSRTFSWEPEIIQQLYDVNGEEKPLFPYRFRSSLLSQPLHTNSQAIPLWFFAGLDNPQVET